jgi:hypothetical protein
VGGDGWHDSECDARETKNEHAKANSNVVGVVRRV